MSPTGGHGSNVVSELNARTVGVSANFAGNVSSKISAENDFRQVGIIKDVLYANTKISLSNVKYSIGATSGSGSSFKDEEVVTQNTTGATGIIKGREAGALYIANTKGIWATGANDTYRVYGGSYANGANAHTNTTTFYYSDNVTAMISNKEKTGSLIFF